MGGMTTVAARFKDGTTTSFRINTGPYFELCFTEEEFKHEMKGLSAKLESVRSETLLSKKEAEQKYRQYDFGNNLLAPFFYGITFYDYLNQAVYTIGDNVSASEYNLPPFYWNPLYRPLIVDKQPIREKHFDQLEEQLSEGHLREILKFKKLKEADALYDLDDVRLSHLKDMDTFKAYQTFFDEENTLMNKYGRLKAKPEGWETHTSLDKYEMLYQYLDSQNILSENDKLGWELFYKDIYQDI